MAFLNLGAFDFRPLSEAKAQLSALVRKLVPGRRRVVITTNGKPTAVLLAYDDYLALAQEREITAEDETHEKENSE